MPLKPGRYFYRDLGDYHDFGICLIAWDRGHVHRTDVTQPRLGVRSKVIFGRAHPEEWRNQGCGENTDCPGWSYNTGQIDDELEFWDKECQVPLDFPEINGRPPNIPQEVIDKAKVEAKAQNKRSKKAEREMAKLRKDDIAAAVRDGITLFECEECEFVWNEDELVVGKLRECPHCAETFVEGDDGRNCPTCNRPFTRLEEEKRTCPDCYDGGEMPDVTILVENGVIVT
jgi:hypothetical protein